MNVSKAGRLLKLILLEVKNKSEIQNNHENTKR